MIKNMAIFCPLCIQSIADKHERNLRSLRKILDDIDYHQDESDTNLCIQGYYDAEGEGRFWAKLNVEVALMDNLDDIVQGYGETLEIAVDNFLEQIKGKIIKVWGNSGGHFYVGISQW